MLRLRDLNDFQERMDQISKELFDGISAAMTPKPWKCGYVDMRWTKQSGTQFSKLRVILPDGTISALLDTPFENVPTQMANTLHDIWKSRTKVFPEKWYGLKLIVFPDGKCELKLDYSPECSVDPTFYDD